MKKNFKENLEKLKEIQQSRIPKFIIATEMYLEGEKEEGIRLFHLLHPSDIAYGLMYLPSEMQKWFFNKVSLNFMGEILFELEDTVKQKLIRSLSFPKFKKIIQSMETNDLVRMVRFLEIDKQADFIKIFPKNEKRKFFQILSYEKNTAGSLMTMNYVSLEGHENVGKALLKLKEMGKKKIFDVYNVFIVNEKNQLEGKVPLNKLIIASKTTKLQTLIEEAERVETSLLQEEVANQVKDYNISSIAVVDDKNRLLGRITVDDVVDIFEKEASKDMNVIAGIKEDGKEETILKASTERVSWLIIGLFGGGLAAGLISVFEKIISDVIVVFFFIPLLTSMGGNVSLQASSIIVKRLTLDHLKYLNFWTIFYKEIRIACLNGFFLSFFLFFFLLLIFTALPLNLEKNLWQISLSVSFALLIVFLSSSIFGVSVPFVLNKMKIDPTVAMGPFIMISNDLLGILIYLFVIKLILF